MNFFQGIVGGPGIQLIGTSFIGRAFCADAKPFLVHIIVAGGIVIQVSAIRPGGGNVVLIEVRGLPCFPPAITELEGKAAQCVSVFTHAGRVGVNFFPVAHQYTGLVFLVFFIGPGIIGIGTKFGKHNRFVDLLFGPIEQIGERKAPVGVDTQHIDILTLPGDDIQEKQVAIANGNRVALADGLHFLRGIIE